MVGASVVVGSSVVVEGLDERMETEVEVGGAKVVVGGEVALGTVVVKVVDGDDENGGDDDDELEAWSEIITDDIVVESVVGVICVGGSEVDETQWMTEGRGRREKRERTVINDIEWEIVSHFKCDLEVIFGEGKWEGREKESFHIITFRKRRTEREREKVELELESFHMN